MFILHHCGAKFFLGGVDLKVYPESFEGIIQSYCERYAPEAVQSLQDIWTRDRHMFDI